jgi:3-deoxy-D-manno-octulosonic-acid transferase
MKYLFNLGYLALGALLAPWFIFKALTTQKYRAGLGQRLGGIDHREREGQSIWIHAVSVGELLAARPLIRELQARYPQYEVVVTYTTRTAAEVARKELPGIYHCYSPLDLSWIVARFFKRLRPALVILMELELWPNWLMRAKQLYVPVLLANGRISAKSFKNYLRFADVLGSAYGGISHWGMQDETYAQRAAELAGRAPEWRNRVWLETDAGWLVSAQDLSFESRLQWQERFEEYLAAAETGASMPLPRSFDPERRSEYKPHKPLDFEGGVPRVYGLPMVPAPVSVAGNLKYDSLKGEADAARIAEFRALFNIQDGEKVLVCGSTHPGEHEALVAMLPRLGVRCVLVPRHPERYAAVRELLTQAGIPWVNRSALTREKPAQAGAVILLDTVGELATVYALADVVFVGGSLIPHGGQNMAEPIALGKAALFGPHADNFKATVRELLEVKGALQVRDAAELESEIKRLLADEAARAALGKAGQARLLASRGALERYLALVDALLGR